MSKYKYTPLCDYLAGIGSNSVTISFAEIEEIIGDSLPPTAFNPGLYETWWGNDRTHTQAVKGWLAAGWHTVDVNLPAMIVQFNRMGRMQS